MLHNEKPYALTHFPAGHGRKSTPAITISDPVVQMSALKRAEDSEDVVVRLYNPTGRERTTVVSLPEAKIRFSTGLTAFQIKTLRIKLSSRRVFEADLLEEQAEPR